MKMDKKNNIKKIFNNIFNKPYKDFNNIQRKFFTILNEITDEKIIDCIFEIFILFQEVKNNEKSIIIKELKKTLKERGINLG